MKYQTVNYPYKLHQFKMFTFRENNQYNTYLVGSVTTVSITVPGRGFSGPLLLGAKNLALIRFVTITNANGIDFGP